MASANGLGFARQERFQRVGHRIDAGRGRHGRWQPDGQARVQDRRLRQQAGMADVALASGGLVGDDAEAVGLRARPGGRRDGDERQARREVRPVVLELPDRHRVDRQQVQCLGGVHRGAATDRHDDRPLQPEVHQRHGAPLHGRSARVGLDLGEHAGVDARRLEDAEDRLDDAGPLHAGVGHDEGPRATGRGDHLGECLDRTRRRTGRGCAGSSRSAGRPASPSADLQDGVGRRVASDREPAAAAVGMEPAFRGDAVRVLEDEHLVEVALVGIADPVRDRAALPAERELVERTGGRTEDTRSNTSAGPRRALVGQEVVRLEP